jgi:hypothetical protein
MQTLISQQQGIELAAAICEEFIHERIRSVHDHQRDPLRLSIGLGQPQLIETVSLMEANLEESLVLDELARHVLVSPPATGALVQAILKLRADGLLLKSARGASPAVLVADQDAHCRRNARLRLRVRPALQPSVTRICSACRLAMLAGCRDLHSPRTKRIASRVSSRRIATDSVSLAQSSLLG